MIDNINVVIKAFCVIMQNIVNSLTCNFIITYCTVLMHRVLTGN